MAQAKKAGAKKTAKKAAAPKKKRDIVAEWTEGYRPFIEGCKERFSFLVGEHGFEEPKVLVAPPDCLVTYTKGESFVRIATEYGGKPFIAVKVDGHEPFGLHVIIDELEPAYAEKAPSAERDLLREDELAAFLDYDAAFVRAHIGELLGAGADLFQRLKAREVAGLRPEP